MNINKTLCKYLDNEKKGYVCIGDVTYFTLYYGVIAAILYGLLYSFYQGCLLIISGRIFGAYAGVISTAEYIGCFGTALMMIILVVLLIMCLDYICKIKIAKCKYKKDEE